MEKGISVYLGLDYTLEENLRYIKLAKEKGFTRIFTSMHIPEANHEDIKNDISAILDLAKELDMIVNVDISPNTFDFFNIEPNDLGALRDLGIRIVRLDFGFTIEEIAEFSNNNVGMQIELNASTFTKDFFNELELYNANSSNFIACHNFYPRNDTGISEELFNQRNAIFKSKDIQISAFIPSLKNKRGPVYEGLPTLEKHRNQAPYVSAKHLFALGIDNVYFGDSQASDEELDSVGSIETPFEFRIDGVTQNSELRKYLLENTFTQRLDEAENVIRIEESRYFFSNDENKSLLNTVLPIEQRPKGSITIDNLQYLRYAGEIQICKIDLPRDERVSLLGAVCSEDMFLIKYIKGGDKIKFKV